MAKAKASIKKGTTDADQMQRKQFPSTLASGFRNTMKYRMSDTCKKAFGVEPVHLACHMCKRADTLCRKGQ